MTAVSLFAGVGGFDIAFERNGVHVAAAVEIDDAARGVLAHNFPTTTLFTDVCEVTGNELRAAGFVPEHGILVGGFPCQDLSVAGKRAGLAGKRSGLFWEICRLIDETQPRWFILENVPGLLSSNSGRDMGTVIGALVERGYGIAWRVLDAQHFGVPQRRRRVFIVGCLGDDGRAPSEVLALIDSSSRDSASSESPRQDAAGAVAEGSGVFGQSSFGGYAEGVKTLTATMFKRPEDSVVVEPLLGSDIVGSLCARDFKGVGNQYVNENKVVLQATYVKAGRAQTVDSPETWREDDVAPTVNTFDTGDSRATVLAVIDDAREIEKHQNGSGIAVGDAPAYTLGRVQQPAVLMRMREGKAGGGKGPLLSEDKSLTLATGNDQTLFVQPAATLFEADRRDGIRIHGEVTPTLQSFMGTGGNNVPMVEQPSVVRRLTPTECERLQGFPDGWTAERFDYKKQQVIAQPDSARYKQMGNAVAVPVVQWIISRLVAHEAGEL